MKLLIIGLDTTINPSQNGRFTYAVGVRETLLYYRKAGWTTIGITQETTNQQNIAQCLFKQRYLLELFPNLNAIVVCTDPEGQQCYLVWRNHFYDVSQEFPELQGTYRQPNPGIIHYLLAVLKPSNVWMIGNEKIDQKTAINAAISFMPAATTFEKYSNQNN
ncbi:MAG: hypothetical protein SAJ12_21195 [Jaaginema sp. PMC 1079.18]|nr:hypothetical protein [Jaaginema sp. PMC 1080.18]MEC4853504.1 hypothetical protein [Jaaginema sp. PMC 1079.18]MEC4866684.1 hypothetical protein [Jaaginema sp. PMC 1078.18]